MANQPQVSPRVLSLIAAAGFILCLSGAAIIGYDAYLGLTTGTIHLSRNPVTRGDGGKFWFNLIGELCSVAILLGGAALTAKLFALSRQGAFNQDAS